jgi:hypothetical protein
MSTQTSFRAFPIRFAIGTGRDSLSLPPKPAAIERIRSDIASLLSSFQLKNPSGKMDIGFLLADSLLESAPPFA